MISMGQLRKERVGCILSRDGDKKPASIKKPGAGPVFLCHPDQGLVEL